MGVYRDGPFRFQKKLSLASPAAGPLGQIKPVGHLQELIFGVYPVRVPRNSIGPLGSGVKKFAPVEHHGPPEGCIWLFTEPQAKEQFDTFGGIQPVDASGTRPSRTYHAA